MDVQRKRTIRDPKASVLTDGLHPSRFASTFHRACLPILNGKLRQRRDRAVRAQGVSLAALLAEVHRLPATTVGAEPRPLG